MTKVEPSPFVATGGEFPLSNLGQLELLRGMAERGLPLRTRVRGLSMTPLIRDDDVLTIAPIGGRDLRLGEVVAFTLPGAEKLAVHRVVARAGSGWLLRGDNCLTSDGIITSEEIVGRVVRVERNGRDVRLGLSVGGAWIAVLNRRGGLARLTALRRLARRAASSFLRGTRVVHLYRGRCRSRTG